MARVTKLHFYSLIPFILLLVLGAAPTVAQTSTYTLKTTIDKALANNPSVRAAKFRVDAAGANLRNAFSHFLPTFSLSGQMQRTYQQPVTSQLVVGGVPQTIQFGFDEPSNLVGYTATLKQDLFTGGRLVGSFRVAKSALKAAAADAKKLGMDIFYAGAESFLGLLKAMKSQTIAEEGLASADAHLKYLRALLQQGLAPRADVLRAEVRYYGARKSRIQAVQAVELARSSFGLVVGELVPADFKLEDVPIVVEKLPYTMEDLENIAFANRPDIELAHARKEMAQGNQQLVRSELVPNLSLSANYGTQRTTLTNANVDYNQNSWNVLAGVRWTLFDGLGNVARVQGAKADWEASLADEKTIRDLAVFNVKQAYFHYLTFVEAMEVSEKSLELAEVVYRLADVKYKSGLGTNSELMDAQVALTSAKTEFASTRLDYILSKAKINKETGTNIFDLLKDIEKGVKP